MGRNEHSLLYQSIFIVLHLHIRHAHTEKSELVLPDLSTQPHYNSGYILGGNIGIEHYTLTQPISWPRLRPCGVKVVIPPSAL